jgi:hypothetical protein
MGTKLALRPPHFIESWGVRMFNLLMYPLYHFARKPLGDKR